LVDSEQNICKDNPIPIRCEKQDKRNRYAKKPTVWTGIDGFGKRKRASIKLEGITINMPLVIEIIDEPAKLEPLLPQVKRMVNDNGIVTLHQVDVI